VEAAGVEPAASDLRLERHPIGLQVVEVVVGVERPGQIHLELLAIIPKTDRIAKFLLGRKAAPIGVFSKPGISWPAVLFQTRPHDVVVKSVYGGGLPAVRMPEAAG
jgi:hypothetical protein